MAPRLEAITDWETRARLVCHKAAPLARLCGCTIRRLERFFQEKRDRCPHDWLIDTRLRHAIELLDQGNATKEVATDVGFKFASNFCRFFRERTGMSPAQYRHNSQRNGAAGGVNGVHLRPDWDPGI